MKRYVFTRTTEKLQLSARFPTMPIPPADVAEGLPEDPHQLTELWADALAELDLPDQVRVLRGSTP